MIRTITLPPGRWLLTLVFQASFTAPGLTEAENVRTTLEFVGYPYIGQERDRTPVPTTVNTQQHTLPALSSAVQSMTQTTMHPAAWWKDTVEFQVSNDRPQFFTGTVMLTGYRIL